MKSVRYDIEHTIQDKWAAGSAGGLIYFKYFFLLA